MTVNSTILNQAKTLLQQSERPLLIAHPRPDGDTIGCVLALRLALIALGKQPRIACVHPVPATYAYLPGGETFARDVPEDADIDLVVAVDMSDLSRTGGLYKESWRERHPLLVIDHHETNDDFGNVNLVTPDAPATVPPILALIEALDVAITPDIATCLLLALLTDTRGLRTSNTTPDVLQLVIRLIEYGGDYHQVVQKTLDAVAYQQMKGWGIALEHLQLEDQVAWTTVPLQAKMALEIDDHDDLDLGNFLSRIAEAQIVVSFLEMSDGTVKLSFRSRPGYNVAWIAQALGGGGHRQAAGCSIEGPLETAPQRVLPLVRQELEQSA